MFSRLGGERKLFPELLLANKGNREVLGVTHGKIGGNPCSFPANQKRDDEVKGYVMTLPWPFEITID